VSVVSEGDRSDHENGGHEEAQTDPDHEDDWFEQALAAEDGDAEDLFSGEWALEDDADEPVDNAEASGSEDEADEVAARFSSVDQAADDLEDAFEEIAVDEEADPFETLQKSERDAGAVDETDPGTDEGASDGGLFDQGFGDALGQAPDLPAESDDGPADGDELDIDEEFDLDAEFEMGNDDFETLGGGGFEGDPDSDIDRIALGIEGLDAMVQGGIPARALMVAIGSAGTGKTTLGLQFLAEGLRNGERAVYITLEESRRRIIRSATEKGFSFDEYAEDGDLAVVDIDPIEMANSLQSIRSELPRLIDEFGASRLVLDSVSLLEMMYDDRAARRNEIYGFTKSLKKAGVTTLMTSEASEESPFASRHGIVEYLTDAVFILQYIRPSDFRETQLAIEIQKIRDANHSRETKPYEITDDGINVYRQANIF
jgi:KaiC domain protein